MDVGRIIYRVEIPDYIEYVILSKERRAKYYKKGDKIPKKYTDRSKYGFSNKGILIDLKTEEKIISNPRSVGTPRRMKIAGQAIWQGIGFHLRSKIARDLKGFFKSHLKELKPIPKDKYPIGVAIDFYKPIGEGNWDLDNHALIYRKTLMDSLKGVIEDDSVQYVRSIPCNYHDCPKEEQRLVVTIFSLKNV